MFARSKTLIGIDADGRILAAHIMFCTLVSQYTRVKQGAARYEILSPRISASKTNKILIKRYTDNPGI